MKAIIIGGGIGGLTTALALLGHGIDVEVYEQAPELREIGAGLQISANGSRVLTRLGLGPQLRRLGVAVNAIRMFDLRTDRVLHAVPPGPVEASSEAMTTRYNGPLYQLHRPDLLGMLIDAVPAGVARLGETAVDFVDDGEGVCVHFESGHQAWGDLLVGADGIHSMVRRQMLGDDEPDFSHIVAWRALVPRDRVAHLNLARDCFVWLGPSRSAVAYWVHRGELLNFVGMVPVEETVTESWTSTGDLTALRQSYAGSNPRLQGILNQIEAAFITGYYFRYPVTEWVRGRVALLGDAVHPMHPFLAQGACQAIEDAAVLGHALRAHGHRGIPAALTEYQRRRLPRASHVQNASRAQEAMWHMANPRDIVQRNRAFASYMDIDPEAQTIYGWLHTYDVDAEAARPLSDPSSVLKRPEAQRAWSLWATMLTPRDLNRRHHGIREAYDRFLLNNFRSTPAATIADICDVNLNYLRVSAAGDGNVIRVLHLHGGGYVLGSAASSVGLASRLADAVAGTVIIPDYRCAPEHPFPAAIEDAARCYEYLLHQGVDPTHLVITGESSGGGLAVALVMHLRDLGHDLPAGVVAICPMGDLTVSGESVDAAAGIDPVCTRVFLTQMATSYLQGCDPRNPLASPIYGDFRGLPPLLIQVADNEALYDDANRMAAAARRDGVEVELDTYSDTVHAFPIFDFLPESAAALARIAKFTSSVTEVRK
jgi:salicylate hydroxylase